MWCWKPPRMETTLLLQAICFNTWCFSCGKSLVFCLVKIGTRKALTGITTAKGEGQGKCGPAERHTHTAEVLNAFSVLVSTGKTHTQDSKAPETSRIICSKKDLALVEEDQLKEYLLINKLEIHKSMGPDSIYPHALRELADVIAKPLSKIFKRSWWLWEIP